MERALEELAAQTDKAYYTYREKIGKPITTLPSLRKDFDVCSAKYVRKALKYIPKEKPKQDKYLADMLNVCSTSATQGDIRKTVKDLRKKPISGWICYLKTCNQENKELSYNDCMRDAPRKEELYFGHQNEWKKEALEGCLRGSKK